jgi:hypothetical protein
MQGLNMATAHLLTGKTAETGLSAFLGVPVITSPARLKRAIADANASLLEDIADMLDPSTETVTFSSGEAAIAIGWSYIDDLEACVSSVNAALHTLNSKSVEVARAHFGNGIANRVRLINETTLDTARYMLEYRISSISRAFGIDGKLFEMDGSGNLRMGLFTLIYDNGDFRATVSSDQQAWIVETETARQVSVREVTADLAWGKLVV